MSCIELAMEPCLTDSDSAGEAFPLSFLEVSVADMVKLFRQIHRFQLQGYQVNRSAIVFDIRPATGIGRQTAIAMRRERVGDGLCAQAIPTEGQPL
jgi:hypothetical protein